MICIVVVGCFGMLMFFAWQKPSTSTHIGRGDTWHAVFANALYLSADKQAVLVTLGTKMTSTGGDTRRDYVAFNDVSNNSVIAIIPLPGTSSRKASPVGGVFAARTFVNGDIFIIADESVLFRVDKTNHTVIDVTHAVFEGQPELAIGVAKIQFTYRNGGQGLQLIANDGKQYYYYPLTHKLYTKEVERDPRNAGGIDEHSGLGFSDDFNSDFPDIPAQLISFSYTVIPDAPAMPKLEHYGNGANADGRWDDPAILASEGVKSHRDFTPGRIYFDYGLLYFDNEYVLISFRLTPGKKAERYLQLLNAHIAAIVFTTAFDELYAPTECIRYKDGFAIASLPTTYTLSLSGKLEKHIPFMFEGEREDSNN